MSNHNDPTPEDGLEILQSMQRMHADMDEADKCSWFVDEFGAMVVPIASSVMKERHQAIEKARSSSVAAGGQATMLLSALAGFLQGCAEAESTVGVREDITSEERDAVSAVYTGLAELVFESSRIAGQDWLVYSLKGKSRFTSE